MLQVFFHLSPALLKTVALCSHACHIMNACHELCMKHHHFFAFLAGLSSATQAFRIAEDYKMHCTMHAFSDTARFARQDCMHEKLSYLGDSSCDFTSSSSFFSFFRFFDFSALRASFASFCSSVSRAFQDLNSVIPYPLEICILEAVGTHCQPCWGKHFARTR